MGREGGGRTLWKTNAPYEYLEALRQSEVRNASGTDLLVTISVSQNVEKEVNDWLGKPSKIGYKRWLKLSPPTGSSQVLTKEMVLGQAINMAELIGKYADNSIKKSIYFLGDPRHWRSFWVGT